MPRSLLISLLAFAFITACGAIAEPTATPTPSRTPTPTLTSTSTRIPSATPDLAATETRIAVRTSEFIEKYAPSLELAGFQIDHGALNYAAPRDLINQMTSVYSRRTWESLPAGTPGDMILHANIMWESTTGLAGCGFYFHGDGDFSGGKYIDFRFYRISGAPTWEARLIEYNRIKGYISGPRNTSAAIDVTNGSINEFIVLVQHPNVTFFANGDRIGAGTLPLAMTEGRVALSLFQESGSTTCRYSDVWVWDLSQE